MKNTFSCLIPFYNESEKILSVLSVLTKIKEFDQIIAVDDGSSDNASQLIQKKFPQVKLVKLPENQGKSGAVSKGVKLLKSEYVFLFDADVSNIQINEVKKAMRVISQLEVDLVIMNKVDPNPDYALTSKITVYSRIACIFSGERVLKTDDLKAVLAEKPKGYQLEAAINQYMMKNHKKAVWVKSSIRHPYSYEEGMRKMADKYTSMATQIIQGVGIANFISQLKGFCLEEG